MIDYKEKKILDLIISKIDTNNCNIIDVGGFEGAWIEEVIKKIPNAKILIIEPNIKNFNIISNKYGNNKNITMINKGASDKIENVTYYDLISDEKVIRGMSGCVLRELYKKYNFQEVEIQTLKIDDLNFDQIDFIKIDTEGFELNVIKGCEQLLLNRKIKFFQFEYGGTYIDKKISLNDVISFCKRFDYHVYDMNEYDGSLTKLDSVIDDYQYNNFLVSFKELI